MRFSLATIAFYAAYVLAQENAINIPSGESTLDITAGQPTTITWQNPSDGTVTIQLQYAGDNQLAGSGIVLECKLLAILSMKTQLTIYPSRRPSRRRLCHLHDSRRRRSSWPTIHNPHHRRREPN
jgi:hypothetical protein